MDNPLETPFENIENAHQYIGLLGEAVAEARQDIDSEILAVKESGQDRRLQALQIVHYKLERLEHHLHACSRTLNDLRSFRRLLLQERTVPEKEGSLR